VLFLLALVPGAGAGGPKPLLAAEWRLGGGVTLLRVDARTLRPLAGSRVDAGSATRPLVRSPAGRYLALSGDNRIRFLDLRTRRVSGTVYPAGWVSGALWTRAPLVAVVGDTVVLVDRQTLSVQRRIEVGGDVLATQRAGAQLALLVGPADAIGPLSLALVDGTGTIRRTALDGLRGGRRTLVDEDRNPVGVRSESPGLAVNGPGTRALVVGRTSVVEVDLVRMTARTRTLTQRTLQKRIEGWERSALWLDSTHVAIFGNDYGARSPTPAPLQIVDLEDWSARTLEVRAGSAIRLGRLLVAVGDDVRAYLPDGSERFRALAGRTGGQVVAGAGLLYVETTGGGTDWVVLDAADGHVVGRRRFARPMNVLPGF
jgi:hypothetical protein